jgi:hypothetical protein
MQGRYPPDSNLASCVALERTLFEPLSEERSDLQLAHRIGNRVTELRIDHRTRVDSISLNGRGERASLVRIGSVVLLSIQNERRRSMSSW